MLNPNLSSLKWSLDFDDFEFFQKTIEGIAGISLKGTKMDLMSSRLRKRAVELGFTSHHDYRLYLESQGKCSLEWQHFINQLTTNKTDFFREPEHFDYLIKSLIPFWIKQGKTKLHIWSCASSTGEEPYTIAMVLAKHLPAGFDFSVLATDIDTEVLSIAKNSVYPKSRLHEIPDDYHDYLSFGRGDVKEWFTFRKQVRDKVFFSNHNLMKEELPTKQKFDLVFCRNVLIYFNAQGIEKVGAKIYSATYQDGVLIIGHSESLQNKKGDWKMGRPSYYFKK